MPSLSQLDQDVLRSLPENILMEIRATYGHQSSNPSSNTSQLKPSKTRSPKKNYQNNKPIPIAGQASVRRMLKLACVKSGDEQLDSNSLSLTQLEFLPLELQLQVANGDDVKIMKKSKSKPNGTIKFDHNDPTDVEIVSVCSSHVEDERGSTSSEKQSKTFYRENVLPLQDFISSNPNPDSGSIDTVRDFLSVGVHEKRLDDVVTFLRTIKNMDNSWDNNIYSQLKKSTMDQVYSTTGDVLDVKWLEL
jgi:hypothetical protein